MTPVSGVWAASITPFREDLSVDSHRLIQHVGHLLDSGCHGVVLLGTTGEANSMSVGERLDLMDAVAESGLPLDRLLAGTGCAAHDDTVSLTARARDHGFRGVLLLPPFYYKNVSDDGIFASICNVVETLGSDVPDIVLYHFPAMSGVGFSHDLIRRLCDVIGSSIVGVKDSTADVEHTLSLVSAFPDLSILAGNEVLLPDLVHEGGAGFISATLNLTAAWSREVYDALTSPGTPFPEAAMERIRSVRSATGQFPFAASIKSVVTELSGFDLSGRLVRPPLVEIPLNEILGNAVSLLAGR